MKAILANLQANALCVAGRHTARQHGVGGLLQGVATSTHTTQCGRGDGRGLLSLSLSLVCLLIRSFGLGFLAFLNFLNFSNPFTRFSFDFVAKFTNLQRFFAKFIQIFTQKFTNFIHFYGLLRRLCRLAMTSRRANSPRFAFSKSAVAAFFTKIFIHFSQIFAQCKLIKNSL